MTDLPSTMDTAAMHTAPRERRECGSGRTRIVLALLLTVACDLLFYGHAVGISLALFLLLLAAAALFAHSPTALRHEALLAAVLLSAGLAPLIESVGILQLAVALAATSAATLLVSGAARAGRAESLKRTALLLFSGPIHAWRGLWQGGIRDAVEGLAPLLRRLLMWGAPLALGSVFVLLFALANPKFFDLLQLLDPWALLALADPLRLLFWAAAVCFVWPFLKVRFAPPERRRTAGAGATARPQRLGAGLVLRSLVVFNAVFGINTALDLVYLWGGREPFATLAYAATAQRAAYLLVVTALLAAAFVLLALRANERDARSRLIRGLIHLWIAQNVGLMLSAIFRLCLYVEVFALTPLRFAVFVWLGLVAIGLVSIVARMVLARNETWLIKTNLLSLGVALYVCALFDVNSFVALYNVAHSREVSGRGYGLDAPYLCELGPSALPAIDRVIANIPATLPHPPAFWTLQECAGRIETDLRERGAEWRAWTFRDHRLQAHVAARYDRRAGGAEHGS